MTRRTPAVEPQGGHTRADHLDQLSQDARAALERILQRLPLIEAKERDWRTGYNPNTGYDSPGRTNVSDPMAEHVAATLSPANADADGNLPCDHDGDEEPPVHRRPTPDPALAATRWLALERKVLRDLFALERLSATLAPICEHVDCGHPTWAGRWCRDHQADAVRDELRADAAKVCVICERPYDASARSGQCPACAQSWTDAHQRGKSRDEWVTQRRLLLGVGLGRAS